MNFWQGFCLDVLKSCIGFSFAGFISVKILRRQVERQRFYEQQMENFVAIYRDWEYVYHLLSWSGDYITTNPYGDTTETAERTMKMIEDHIYDLEGEMYVSRLYATEEEFRQIRLEFDQLYINYMQIKRAFDRYLKIEKKKNEFECKKKVTDLGIEKRKLRPSVRKKVTDLRIEKKEIDTECEKKVTELKKEIESSVAMLGKYRMSGTEINKVLKKNPYYGKKKKFIVKLTLGSRERNIRR